METEEQPASSHISKPEIPPEKISEDKIAAETISKNGKTAKTNNDPIDTVISTDMLDDLISQEAAVKMIGPKSGRSEESRTGVSVFSKKRNFPEDEKYEERSRSSDIEENQNETILQVVNEEDKTEEKELHVRKKNGRKRKKFQQLNTMQTE